MTGAKATVTSKDLGDGLRVGVSPGTTAINIHDDRYGLMVAMKWPQALALRDWITAHGNETCEQPYTPTNVDLQRGANVLWSRQFKGTPWEGKVQLINPDSMEEYRALALQVWTAVEEHRRSHQNVLKHVTSEWATENNDLEVTVHHRMVEGVLCRWWGDGPTPDGVALIDKAITLKACDDYAPVTELTNYPRNEREQP